eukprot:3107288-Pleurochrysis_carterae.AAC.1
MIQWVYPDMHRWFAVLNNSTSSNATMQEACKWLSERCLLASRHETVDELNKVCMQKLPGKTIECISMDSYIEADDHMCLPVEALHENNPTGMAPPLMELKAGCMVMLLRNFSIGLCNGTRLLVKQIVHHRTMVASILTGDQKHLRCTVMLPCIHLYPKSKQNLIHRTDWLFQSNQLLPWREGGLFSTQETQCFAYGQLYVASSGVSML